jgi:hypothetical protein
VRLHISALGIPVAIPPAVVSESKAKQNRRRHARVEVPGALRAHAEALGTLDVRDFSAEGFAVQAPVPLVVGSYCAFLLTRADGATARIQTSVAHSTRVDAPAAGFLVGFCCATDADREKLSHLVEGLTVSSLAQWSAPPAVA